MKMIKKGKELQAHIGIFGNRNSGKSSILNLIAEQSLAIVSDTPGTTTDPVRKSIELKGIGPTVLIDTAGIDDVGDLGNQRIDKTLHEIEKVDLGILVITDNKLSEFDIQLINKFEILDTPYFIIHNKSDLNEISEELKLMVKKERQVDIIGFSVFSDRREVITKLIKKNLPDSVFKKPTLVGDLVNYGDIVLLITPIDIEAPEGRLILPQVQAIRDILDNDATAIVVKEREVDSFLKKTGIKPALAITDSQIFLKADASIPIDIPLTGFSVLLARYKGDFEAYLEGTPKISKLRDGDNVLLLESCTHQVACDDIGRVKLPRWIRNFTGKKLNFDVVGGLNSLENNINTYSLVIQCGGCVVTHKQLINRLKLAKDSDIAITNYGMAIAYVQGVYKRAIEPFVKLKEGEEDYL